MALLQVTSVVERLAQTSSGQRGREAVASRRDVWVVGGFPAGAALRDEEANSVGLRLVRLVCAQHPHRLGPGEKGVPWEEVHAINLHAGTPLIHARYGYALEHNGSRGKPTGLVKIALSKGW